MYTPHPSYPPLDLAASGAVVLTNKFGLKNNLSNYSQNIICKNLSVDDLVEGIAEAIKIIEDEHLRQSNFDQNSLQKDWHYSFKDILDKLILQEVDMDHQLKETQLELGRTKNELTATKSHLYETQSQLEETELKLQKIQSYLAKQLSESQLQLEETQSHLTKQLNNSQIQLETAENTIIAMETSKFWKLRKKWFKFKYLIKTYLLLISTYGLKNTLHFLHFLPKEDEILSSDNGDYQKWLENNYPRRKDLISMAINIKNIDYKPIISLILPTYNTPENFLIEAIESVLNQVYPYWELCIADDCSTQPHVTRILREYTRKDKRIKVIYRDTNGHISLASNSALEIATGEYIALFDHDDLLTPHALYEVVSLLNQHPEADFIYTDEDKVDENNILKEAFFKPDWCPDSFLSRMYTCHLGVYRRSIINEIGGFRVGFEGSQDYDLVLRFTEKTDKIFHIPNILYHWRIHSESTAGDANAKNYAYDAAQKAITEAITRRGENGTVIKNEQFLGVYKIRYEIKEPKLVSIIIPTKDLGKLLHQCLESIFTKTTYPNYEVIVIDNGSVESETFACFDYWGTKEPSRFKYYTYDIPFNYSKLNNYGVEKAKGDYLLFLNNDTEVISEDWLEAMVEQSQRKSIGVVGCLLLYPDNTIQHAGVVLGPPGGMAGHGHKFSPSTHGGYFGQLVSINNYSTVTGACMMCRRDVFMEVNGFEEYLEVACNDIDLCLKIGERGYRNIYLPHVMLYHHESKTRGIDDTPEKKLRSYKELKYMWGKWQNLIDNDPCYNPNLTKEKEDYSINLNKKYY
jgi:glycosyltransferase involved in cell wall biosynthesis